MRFFMQNAYRAFRAGRGGGRGVCLVLLAALVHGCATPPPAPPPRAVPAEVRAAEALYEEGRIVDALTACVELHRRDPLMPGLAELQQRILARLNIERERQARALAALSRDRMGVEVEERRAVPDTYRLPRGVRGERDPLRTARTPMEEALDRRVTVHLDGVGLAEFILAVGQAEGISIITDAAELDRTMTLHAEEVPLREILDFAARNLGVTFYLGENLIWATPSVEDMAGAPLETRFYRLRRGMAGLDLVGDDPAASFLEALARFVPEAEGADQLFDPKAHLLILRNTRANLAAAEAIIEALDVTPPQILIEARFIATSVGDLRELGVDWLLTSPVTVTRRGVMRDGRWDGSAPATRIDSGAGVTFAGFPNAAQGLSLTYQGVLTDPMFQAVLHALETSGRARTLSVPKVTAVNNRPATLRVGEDFRYFEEYDIQSTPSTTEDGQTIYRTTLVPVGRPQIEELGIELSVKPSVGADLGAISLVLLPEISEFVRYEFYRIGTDDRRPDERRNDEDLELAEGLVRLPIFRRSRIETEVIVRSGETVVMGGLITSQENVQQGRVPILSSIPLIGRLFTQDQIEETRQNLLIFVTASLISELGETLVPLDEWPPEDEEAPDEEAPAEDTTGGDAAG